MFYSHNGVLRSSKKNDLQLYTKIMYEFHTYWTKDDRHILYDSIYVKHMNYSVRGQK